MNDKTPGACQCHEKHAPTYWKGVVREYQDALEKAEQERDHWKREADGANADLADLRAAESRPLTPDAITDEMIQRAKRRFEELDWALIYTKSNWVFRQVLTAALTEPPARPEGAERWEDFLIDSLDYQALTDQQIADLADRIAEEMNR